mmetsp:Transcript_97067/g.280136  ORF Transcript_97067/g.280136 Transcript_97067/m.280136 type:complete len:318 (+) Transcript_97067:220-1173(+)
MRAHLGDREQGRRAVLGATLEQALHAHGRFEDRPLDHAYHRGDDRSLRLVQAALHLLRGDRGLEPRGHGVLKRCEDVVRDAEESRVPGVPGRRRGHRRAQLQSSFVLETPQLHARAVHDLLEAAREEQQRAPDAPHRLLQQQVRASLATLELRDEHLHVFLQVMGGGQLVSERRVAGGGCACPAESVLAACGDLVQELVGQHKLHRILDPLEGLGDELVSEVARRCDERLALRGPQDLALRSRAEVDLVHRLRQCPKNLRAFGLRDERAPEAAVRGGARELGLQAASGLAPEVARQGRHAFCLQDRGEAPLRKGVCS